MKRIFEKLLLTVLVLAVTGACLLAFAACGEKGTSAPYTPATFDETRIYELDPGNTNLMGNETARLALALFLDKEETYFKFETDGTVHGQFKTIPLNVNSLFDTLGKYMSNLSKDNLVAQLKNTDIAETLNENVEPMFPGFIARFIEGDVEGAMKLVQDSVGLNIVGLDFSDEKLKNAVLKMGEQYKKTNGKSMRLPADIFDIIPEEFSLVLTADWQYNLVSLTGNDGTIHDAVYIGGEPAHSALTQPFAIFSRYAEDNGSETMYLRIEVANIDLALKLKETK